MKLKIVLWVTGIVLGIVVIGCYTVLRHPIIRDTDSEPTASNYEVVEHNTDCQECHDRSYYNSYYHPSVLTGALNAPNFYRWHYYYEYPWWASEYYYTTENEDEQNVPTPTDFRRRHKADSNQEVVRSSGDNLGGDRHLAKESTQESPGQTEESDHKRSVSRRQKEISSNQEQEGEASKDDTNSKRKRK